MYRIAGLSRLVNTWEKSIILSATFLPFGGFEYLPPIGNFRAEKMQILPDRTIEHYVVTKSLCEIVCIKFCCQFQQVDHSPLSICSFPLFVLKPL